MRKCISSASVELDWNKGKQKEALYYKKASLLFWGKWKIERNFHCEHYQNMIEFNQYITIIYSFFRKEGIL